MTDDPGQTAETDDAGDDRLNQMRNVHVADPNPDGATYYRISLRADGWILEPAETARDDGRSDMNFALEAFVIFVCIAAAVWLTAFIPPDARTPVGTLMVSIGGTCTVTPFFELLRSRLLVYASILLPMTLLVAAVLALPGLDRNECLLLLAAAAACALFVVFARFWGLIGIGNPRRRTVSVKVLKWMMVLGVVATSVGTIVLLLPARVVS